ncbi:hypothetical protein EKD04_014325 [Chloroflexales bacterium ZM16-3]|nr:hypothetical protein [Chloroflexales bacterium ZM16-3]
MDRRYTIWPLLSILLLASMLALPESARARSVVVHSTPSDGAVLRDAPQMLQLWYDSAAIIEPGAVSLTDAEGREVAIAGFHSDIYRPNDAGLSTLFDPTFLFLCSLGLNSYPTTLMVHMPALGPGTYRLSWHAIAIKDRQDTSGSLVFAVDPTAPASAAGDDGLSHSMTSLADDLMVTMAIRPNRPGANFVSVQAAAVRRPIRAPIGQMTIRLTPPGGEPRDVVVTPSPDGKFLASGDLIDRPGLWTAELRTDRGVAPATVTTLTWDVPGSPSGTPFLGLILALSGAALLGGGVFGLRRWQG